jgi:hypothetical protein
MTEEQKDKKKIIIDEDWKQQAKKEKEILAAKEDEAEKQKTGQDNHRQPLPKGDFAALLSMLFTQTLFSMGLLQVQGEDKRAPDLGLAKYNIDMLEALEEKTKGNLSEAEQKALVAAINDLRMAYVKVAEAIQNQT